METKEGPTAYPYYPPLVLCSCGPSECPVGGHADCLCLTLRLIRGWWSGALCSSLCTRYYVVCRDSTQGWGIRNRRTSLTLSSLDTNCECQSMDNQVWWEIGRGEVTGNRGSWAAATSRCLWGGYGCGRGPWATQYNEQVGCEWSVMANVTHSYASGCKVPSDGVSEFLETAVLQC